MLLSNMFYLSLFYLVNVQPLFQKVGAPCETLIQQNVIISWFFLTFNSNGNSTKTVYLIIKLPDWNIPQGNRLIGDRIAFERDILKRLRHSHARMGRGSPLETVQIVQQFKDFFFMRRYKEFW